MQEIHTKNHIYFKIQWFHSSPSDQWAPGEKCFNDDGSTAYNKQNLKALSAAEGLL